MATTIQIVGIEQAVANLGQLPRKVALKHLRIALNAAGGTIKGAVVALAPRDTKLLAKSQAVKVKIPDASWDVKHHGRPAYVVIGTKRGSGKFLRPNKRGYGAANAFFKIQLARSGRAAALDATRAKFSGVAQRAKLGKRAILLGKAVYKNPSRYAHLAEIKHKFTASAARIAGPRAASKAAQKLAAAFETEAAALPK